MPQNKEAAENVNKDSIRQLPAARVALRVLNFQSRFPQEVHRSINASVHKATSGSVEEPRPAIYVQQIVHLSWAARISPTANVQLVSRLLLRMALASDVR